VAAEDSAIPESAPAMLELESVPTELASVPLPPVVAPRSGDAALSEKLPFFSEQGLRHQFLGWLMGAPALDEIKKAFFSIYVVEDMLADNFERVEYLPHESLSDKQLHRSQLRGWNMSTGNDFLKAKYRGVSFEFSDVELSSRTHRDRFDTMIFLGQWLILDLHKRIPAPLLVSEFENKDSLGEETQVHIERYPLGDTFTVLTELPELVLCVLTPAFMEFLLRHRFSNSEDPFSSNARTLHLFFWGRQVQIGINSRRNFFEPRGPGQDISALRERIQGEIDFIKEIIDGFLLIEWLFQREQSEGGKQNGPVQTDLLAQVLPEISNGAAFGGDVARNRSVYL